MGVDNHLFCLLSWLTKQKGSVLNYKLLTNMYPKSTKVSFKRIVFFFVFACQNSNCYQIALKSRQLLGRCVLLFTPPTSGLTSNSALNCTNVINQHSLVRSSMKLRKVNKCEGIIIYLTLLCVSLSVKDFQCKSGKDQHPQIQLRCILQTTHWFPASDYSIHKN